METKQHSQSLFNKDALLLAKESNLSIEINHCENDEKRRKLKKKLRKTIKAREKVQKQIEGEEVSESGSSSDSNDSDSVSTQHDDKCNENNQNTLSTEEKEEGKEPSLEKILKKYKNRFDISNPTKEEAKELIGLKIAKLFLKGVMKGPTEFPAHANRMRAKSKLKAILLHGPPGKIT